MNRQRVITLIAAGAMVFVIATHALGQNKADKVASDTPNKEAPAQSATKKKGFLEKLNQKLEKINSAITPRADGQQTGSQPPETPADATSATNDVKVADASTTQAAEPATTTATAGAADAQLVDQPAKPPKKHGFLDKLNDNLKKANEKLDKVSGTLSKTPDSTSPTDVKPEAAPAKTAAANEKAAVKKPR